MATLYTCWMDYADHGKTGTLLTHPCGHTAGGLRPLQPDHERCELRTARCSEVQMPLRKAGRRPRMVRTRSDGQALRGCGILVQPRGRHHRTDPVRLACDLHHRPEMKTMGPRPLYICIQHIRSDLPVCPQIFLGLRRWRVATPPDPFTSIPVILHRCIRF